MLLQEDIELFRKVIPFYDHLTSNEETQLIENTSKFFYKKGEVISRGKNQCTGLFLVKSGQIRAYIMSSEGKEITLYRLLDTDFCIMTASCVFKNLNFDVHLEVEKDSEIYVVPTRIIDELNQKNIFVKEYMLELMASKFSDVMWVMDQVVFGSLSKRVACFLMEQTILENNLKLTITHETIGKNIGTAREVVSRMLKYFENDHVLEISRGTITVLDVERLRMLAN